MNQNNSIRLKVLPTRVFKRTPDFNREGMEGWAFFLAIESDVPETIECRELSVTLFKADNEVIVRQYTKNTLSVLGNLNLKRVSPEIKDAEILQYWTWVMRLRFMEPQRLKIDKVKCDLLFQGARGEEQISLDIPIEQYVQKTELIFPFRGAGIISQGGVINEGHRNRSGQFAIDALGLTAEYAPMLSESNKPESYAGWERPILAPASGRIVFARGDRPDQPVAEVSDPNYYAPEYQNGGDPGNYVVIDHGNNEFSMIAHLREDSLTISIDDEVEQGEQLGVMGNSGDTTGPHLHHQLQNGLNWEFSDALPHHYINGPETYHDRGWYFSVI